MSIARISVNRPVTTIMFFMLCFLLGVMAWNKLPRELFPPITFPQLTIVTMYPNAAPEEIENLITKTVEEAIGTVKDLKRVTSISKEGASLVTAEFAWNTNMNFASLWVREKLDQIKEQLPPECKEPVVIKHNPFSQPVIMLNVTAQMSGNELLGICKKIVKDKLEKTEGVASVEISGGEEQEIVVNVDQGRLLANQLSLTQVVESVRNSNLNYPAGTTNEKMYEYLIRTIGEFKQIREIGETVIETTDYQSQKLKYREQRDKGVDLSAKHRRLIRLSDIASIDWSLKERTSYSRYNRVDNISISVHKRAETNTIAASDRIREAVDGLQATLKPHGVKVEVVYDQAEYIKNSISGLVSDAEQGAFLAFIVIYFFLQNFILALIVSVSIPMSILMTLALMYMSGISLNTMSLGGLALGAGMLVDTTIVVIENAFRHYTKIKNMKEASITGTEEMTGPVVSSTFTQIAVFLPLLFVIGLAGQIFKELSLTVVYTQIVSILVSLSLVPKLVASLKGIPGSGDAPSPMQNKISSLIPQKIKDYQFIISHYVKDRLLQMKPAGVTLNRSESVVRQYYTHIIELFLNNRKKLLAITLAAFAVSIFILAFFVEKTFLPKIDQGQFIINVDLPVGTRLDVTDDVAKRVEQEIAKVDQVKSILTQVGATSEQALETLRPNQSKIVVSLCRSRSDKPLANARLTGFRPTSEIIDQIRSGLSGVSLEGAKITYAMQDSMFTSALEKTSPVVIEVKGQSMDKLMGMTDEIDASLKAVPGIVNIKDDRPLPSPETKMTIDKDKASTFNVSVSDIARTSLIALKGMSASKFKQEGNEYDITVRLAEKDRQNLASLESLLVHAPEGFNFPIKEVASIVIGKGPSQIRRLDQQRTIVVTADLNRVSQKTITPQIDALLAKYKNTSGYSATLGGESENIRESFISMLAALIFAVLLIYMIMASQFESFLQPFVILFTIPLSMIGVSITLLLTHTSLNAISFLGIIILGGIVVNNGIVLIDYTNLLRAEGLALREALINASVTRLRPILMTASSSVLGLIPLALGIGDGAELRAPMAITIIGGIIASTVLTLGVIPAVYLILENWLQSRRKA